MTKRPCPSRQDPRLFQIQAPYERTTSYADQFPYGSYYWSHPGRHVVRNRDLPPDTQGLEDFHCPDCGLTQTHQPRGKLHLCPKICPKGIEYQKVREHECFQNECNFNQDGICLRIYDPNDDKKPGDIRIGHKMPWAACPDGRYPRVARRCPDCNAFLFDGKREPRYCRYCHWSAFQPAEGRIGFLGPSYLEIGGTETWHRTLLPRLEGVTGYVALNEQLSNGDPELLEAPFGAGFDDARQLVAASEMLVVWGLGHELSGLLAGFPRKRVISVAHCDATSDWTIRTMKEQEQFTDRFVYIEPSGREAIPESSRSEAVLIRNGISEDRVESKLNRNEAREKLGIQEDQKLLLMMTRISPEKGIHLVVDAVSQLPDEYALIIAGKSQGFAMDYHSSLNLSDRTQITNPVSHPGNLLRAADAYISASDFEGAGLSMIEAAMAGVPLISTPTGIVGSDPEVAATFPIQAEPHVIARVIEEDFRNAKQQAERARSVQRQLIETYSADRFAHEWRQLLG